MSVITTALPFPRLARSRSRRRFSLSVAALLGSGLTAWAGTTAPLVGPQQDPPRRVPVDQFDLMDRLALDADDAFEQAFEEGDELFETRFTAADGVGANVMEGQRFTRVPRADKNDFREWARHTPSRATGPNAEACNACHNAPFDDGAGAISANVHRDPFHTGRLENMIQRNTPHLFAPGALQRLAEEMTDELHAIRDEAVETVEDHGGTLDVALVAKGVNFGSLEVSRSRGGVRVDTSDVRGVDDDLIVRPFQWKGSRGFLRDFNRDASHNELGMQAVEIAGDGVDGDGDRVVDEMSVGDQTVLTVYLAAQPRPTTKLELNALGLLDPPLTGAEIQAIKNGRRRFGEIGCAECHVPALLIDDPIFSEPSANRHYRDQTLPAGQDPQDVGLDWRNPIRFDLTEDQPDNQLHGSGGEILRLGSLRRDRQGRAIARIFGDLKRHDMGDDLAESLDEVGTGRATFMTENLWGVGSTAPYLHDGRATTLTEAILEHGGEARSEREDFEDLRTSERQEVIAFLENLVLFKIEEEEEIRVDPRAFEQADF